jgi:sulfite exporter TauE/SafE/plastocyanin domain-containing protein/copper chaperone CopZ
MANNIKIKIYDMSCTSCEKKLEKEISLMNGVKSVRASFKGEYAQVEYDESMCSQKNIEEAIVKLGYRLEKSSDHRFIGMVLIVGAIMLLGFQTAGFDMESMLQGASYGVLFLVGILTSLHCVGMCGGIMLSQSVSDMKSDSKIQSIKPAAFYNIGRVASYTILGGLVGAVGSIFSISIAARAGIQIFAGIFMIVMGFNLAGFSFFKKINLRLPAFCAKSSSFKSPFIVGLLNGFMPCGPLQTMQLFALAAGSASRGALSMFFFSLGTVPLMVSFGALSGLLSKGNTKKILKLSGVLIIVLGLIMGNRGFALAGIEVNPVKVFANELSRFKGGSQNSAVSARIEDGVQVIEMTASNSGYAPNAFYVQKDIPVRWIINGEQINSCNNAIVARSIGLEQKLLSGENIIEFTPGDEDINFSCWMGMIRGVILVVDDINKVDPESENAAIPPQSSGPSCCAVPVDDQSDETIQSIYGDDISAVPTEFLIEKQDPDTGKIYIDGIGYELQPLVGIVQTGKELTLEFNFSEFIDREDSYYIINNENGSILESFTVSGKTATANLTPDMPGTYLIAKNQSLIGIIHAEDNPENLDIESIRRLYFD